MLEAAIEATTVYLVTPMLLVLILLIASLPTPAVVTDTVVIQEWPVPWAS